MKESYHELLSQEEWKDKCLEILNRDHSTCQKCKKKGIRSWTYFQYKNLEELGEYFNGFKIDGKSFVETIENLFSIVSQETEMEKADFDKIKSLGDINVYRFSFFHNLVAKDNLDNLEVSKEININEIFNWEDPMSFFPKPSESKVQYKDYCFYHYISAKKMSITLSSPFFSMLYREKDELGIDFGYKNLFFRIKFTLFPSHNSLDIDLPTLNIHHKYYMKDKKPWEYGNESLITLCQECHQKEHEENGIFMYDEKMNQLYQLDTCPRCGGSGYKPEYHYCMDGICFKCKGEGVIHIS